MGAENGILQKKLDGWVNLKNILLNEGNKHQNEFYDTILFI